MQSIKIGNIMVTEIMYVKNIGNISKGVNYTPVHYVSWNPIFMQN